MLILAVVMTGCFKVVKLEDEAALAAAQTFDVSKNVAGFWETQAVPELLKKAVPLVQLIDESKGDFTSLASKYGKYSMGTSGELSFTVSAEGEVSEVNIEKKAGYIILKLSDYDGPYTIKVQVGPVYKGSAVRDSLNSIRYDDYTNQVDWAAVSQNIHKEIQKAVIDELDIPSLQGKKITLTGCFTVGSTSEIVITPVKMSQL